MLQKFYTEEQSRMQRYGIHVSGIQKAIVSDGETVLQRCRERLHRRTDHANEPTSMRICAEAERTGRHTDRTHGVGTTERLNTRGNQSTGQPPLQPGLAEDAIRLRGEGSTLSQKLLVILAGDVQHYRQIPVHPR